MADDTNKNKSKSSKDFFSKMDTKKLDGVYSVLSRGNGGGSANSWIDEIQGEVGGRIDKFLGSQKSSKGEK